MVQDLRFAFRSLGRRKGLLALAITTLALGDRRQHRALQPGERRVAPAAAVPVARAARDSVARVRPRRAGPAGAASARLSRLPRSQQDARGVDHRHRPAVDSRRRRPTRRSCRSDSVAAHFFPFLGVEPHARPPVPREGGRAGRPARRAPQPSALAVALRRRSRHRRPDDRSQRATGRGRRRAARGVPAGAARGDLRASRLGCLAAGADRLLAAAAAQPDGLHRVRAACARRRASPRRSRSSPGIAAQLRAEVAVHRPPICGSRSIPFHHDVVKGARSGLWMLMAAVGLLLAIASVNVALLMLARARERDRELLVRSRRRRRALADRPAAAGREPDSWRCAAASQVWSSRASR